MISPLLLLLLVILLLLLLQGRFTIAAKHHISIAEIYESELVDIEKVVLHDQRLRSRLIPIIINSTTIGHTCHEKQITVLLFFFCKGYCTLWASSRLLQRRRIQQVPFTLTRIKYCLLSIIFVKINNLMHSCWSVRSSSKKLSSYLKLCTDIGTLIECWCCFLDHLHNCVPSLTTFKNIGYWFNGMVNLILLITVNYTAL